MDQEQIDSIIFQVINNYCVENWENVVNYYGEDVAQNFDFLQPFPYKEIYQDGSDLDCEALYNLGIIQSTVVSAIFDIVHDKEAQLTYNTIQYHMKKLKDKAEGIEEHTWLN